MVHNYLMGIQESILKRKKEHTLSDTQIEEFKKITHFSPLELQALYERFMTIGKTKKKKTYLSLSGFKKLAIKSELLSEMVFNVFDIDGDKKLDFKEYVTGLSTVCSRAEDHEKISFLFKVFDSKKKDT